MKLLSTDNYIKFKCIAEACPISCCGGDWGIPIDDETMEYYMSIKGDFGETLRQGITIMNGGYAFKLDEVTRDCVFLDENRLCRIYKKLGPDALCSTCMSYPRAFYQVHDIGFCYLSNSCPEVNRMIFQRERPLDTLYDDSNCENEITEDDLRFKNAIIAFKNALNIIQNRDCDIRERMIRLILFVNRFQKIILNGDDSCKFFTSFSGEEIYSSLSAYLNIENVCNPSIRIDAFMKVYKYLMSDSYDHNMWDNCLGLAHDLDRKGIADIDFFKSTIKNMEEKLRIELEQIMAYRVFSMFMQGYDNSDYFEKLAYEIVMCTALVTYSALVEVVQGHECSQEDRILFYSLCGRIDHTTKMKESLLNDLKISGFYEADTLIKLVN